MGAAVSRGGLHRQGEGHQGLEEPEGRGVVHVPAAVDMQALQPPGDSKSGCTASWETPRLAC